MPSVCCSLLQPHTVPVGLLLFLQTEELLKLTTDLLPIILLASFKTFTRCPRSLYVRLTEYILMSEDLITLGRKKRSRRAHLVLFANAASEI